MAFLSPAAGAIPHVEAGKLRAVAVTGARRSSLYPDVPTVAETLPGYEVNSWYGLMAPAGTPRGPLPEGRDPLPASSRGPHCAPL